MKRQLSKHESQLSRNEEKGDADDWPEVCYWRADSQGRSGFASQQPAASEDEEVPIAPAHPQEVCQECLRRGCKKKCHSHFHQTISFTTGMTTILFSITTTSTPNYHPQGHHRHCSQEELNGARLATLVWMVIRSDGLCNFGDGLAID